MTSNSQKYQSNLAPIWFSRSSLSFLKDFAVDDDEKLTTVKRLERFLEIWRIGDF